MICNPQQPGCSQHIDGIGGLQIPQLNRSNLFLRRIAYPSGRLAEDSPMHHPLKRKYNIAT